MKNSYVIKSSLYFIVWQTQISMLNKSGLNESKQYYGNLTSSSNWVIELMILYKHDVLARICCAYNSYTYF